MLEIEQRSWADWLDTGNKWKESRAALRLLATGNEWIMIFYDRGGLSLLEVGGSSGLKSWKILKKEFGNVI